MHQLIYRTFAAAVITVASLTVTACHPHPHEGPAQHVGRHIDHAADKTGDAIEGTGRAINRALPGD